MTLTLRSVVESHSLYTPLCHASNPRGPFSFPFSSWRATFPHRAARSRRRRCCRRRCCRREEAARPLANLQQTAPPSPVAHAAAERTRLFCSSGVYGRAHLPTRPPSNGACVASPLGVHHRARWHGRTNVLYLIEYPGGRTGPAAPPALSGSSPVPRRLGPACDHHPRHRVLRIRKIGVHLWVRGPVVRQIHAAFPRNVAAPTVAKRFGAVAQHLNRWVLSGHPRGSPKHLET